MKDLSSTTIRQLKYGATISTSEQISNYINSIISADSVALGGGIPDIYSKANGCNKLSTNNSVVIGHNAENSDVGDYNTSVVAIGSGAKANNYGTAIGVGTKAYLGMAFGADAWAGPEEDQYKEAGKTYEDSPQNAVAIGRYAKSTASGAIQLGGQREEIEPGKLKYYGVNNDANSLKFYVGGDDKKNITVVHSDGTISADNSYKSNKIKCSGLVDSYVQISVVNEIPEGVIVDDNTFYFVVES